MGSPSSCSSHVQKYYKEITQLVNTESLKPENKEKSKDQLYLDVATSELIGFEEDYNQLINAIKSHPEYSKIQDIKDNKAKALKKKISANNKEIADIKSQLSKIKKPAQERVKSNIEQVFESLGKKILSADDIMSAYKDQHDITQEQADKIAFIQDNFLSIISNDTDLDGQIKYGIGYSNRYENKENGKVKFNCGE